MYHILFICYFLYISLSYFTNLLLFFFLNMRYNDCIWISNNSIKSQVKCECINIFVDIVILNHHFEIEFV